MTDPLRRDPAEFLRVLKRMAYRTSWQKTLIFASKGRQVGYKLTIDHYNSILFSQSLWGRALELIKVIRAMEEDKIQPNGASYYYICNGMANADHGYVYDFCSNSKLPALQHWRVALNALQAAEANGFDSTDTMHNSVIVSCTIPTINQWQVACQVMHKLLAEERKLHPTSVMFFRNCLVRNMRPREANILLGIAQTHGVEGYGEVNGAQGAGRSRALAAAVVKKLHEYHLPENEWDRNRRKIGVSESEGGGGKVQRNILSETLDDEFTGMMTCEEKREEPPFSSFTSTLQKLTPAEEANVLREQNTPVPFMAGLHQTELNSHFRPRVYRQEWYKWHAIANKYRPQYALRKKQLAPRDSPAGIPGFHRL